MAIKIRFLGTTLPLSWIEAADAVIVYVEYRCAPQVQGARIVIDWYAGLCWASEHIKKLDVHPGRRMVAGWSGDGGLAAGTSLPAQDWKGPKLCAQFLVCLTLDDKSITTSSKQ